ncbi:2-isopropylmalate synthase [Intestinibacter sp.]|uniref:2-isopropylmalate synthase n=1 Tax=Intestinibacter sp. TaxID=1965304 RepID=UPI002A75126B|nr:2-isopropylmalate synthase [Intestinibacter sp.]MDY2738176.1 2-isopropylmalate synthase [Intestinibacter sp.]
MKNNEFNYKKYVKPDFQPKNFINREWPDKEITKAPIWCSVDLRDGNQSLPTPMSVDEKMRMFNMLLEVGFKEIEIGFPSASQTEYDFLRKLIDENLIPDDVKVQVLTQSREHLITKTFEALKGCKNAIVHLYNSTSVLQRDVVFNMNKEEIIDIAVKGAKLIKEEAAKYPETNFQFEYSPESFTGTEMDYALEICEAVMDVWEPTPENKMIINLPSTVEMTTPNRYADQIEWFSKTVKNRECVSISLHPHNDRGTSTAAAELGLLAGADRIEGTLFGNGERTGNLDILIVGMNMYSQGIDPELDFSDINDIAEIYKDCTKLSIHERHPYVGDLVFTAFSGSHQDAIRKGMKAREARNEYIWQVPYLPLDPHDLGREYTEIIRINSQSGKGGAAYIMESEFGYNMPKAMQKYFGKVVKKCSDSMGKELSPQEIFGLFEKWYINIETPYKLTKYKISSADSGLFDVESGDVATNMLELEAIINFNNHDYTIKGTGNGPVDAFSNALMEQDEEELKPLKNYKFVHYHEHALGEGSHVKGVAYIQIDTGATEPYFGVGISENINTAAISALMHAINKSYIKMNVE